ncbi:hypothetical protein MTO98_31795 [Mucilaginibacter sp. SMC90]|uniref:hypothetical protein n=1 Tax=Mucilaginibacter sp. SMC90 TaxID=2929803 RepID=UPI001FB2E3B5|nr:hypothetical protein [Mucilaginibacter sp. SMC90]UOE48984.1 hypothetical protein MTO98_31795 [Mucilaginibacter sp. SMC90]
MNRILILSIVVLLLICKTSLAQHKHGIKFPPPVLEFQQFAEFCDLPAQKNELVYTRAVYSYKDTGWSLRSDGEKCTKITANMFLADGEFLRPDFLKSLKVVHQNPDTKFLIVDIIGFFEDDLSGLEHDIGDMGTNKYRFIVKRVVSFYLETR